MTGNVYILLVSASLGGAVVGFLFYNFNPAKIFMGDSGSMFLGFVLASASLLGAGTQKSPTLIAIVVPILALGLPILDMLMTIARRFLERRSIFSADRGHIHHRLLDMGLTHRRSVLSLYLMSIAFTIVALIAYVGRSWQVGFALFALTAVLIAVVRFVGYFSTIVNAGASRRARPGASPAVGAPRPASNGDRQPRSSSCRRFSASSVPRAACSRFGSSTRRTSDSNDGAGSRRRRKRSRREKPSARGSRSRTATRSWSCSSSSETPRAESVPRSAILLQLVADGAEALLALPREAIRPPAQSWRAPRPRRRMTGEVDSLSDRSMRILF